MGDLRHGVVNRPIGTLHACLEWVNGSVNRGEKTGWVARFQTLALGRNKVVLDTEIGHLRGLELAMGRDAAIAPLHTAPWLSDAPLDRTSAVRQQRRA